MAINQPPLSRPPSSAPNGGRITAQVPTIRNLPGLGAVRGVNVSFVTGKEQSGEVFIPNTEYQEVNVLAAVRAAANRIDSLHGAEF